MDSLASFTALSWPWYSGECCLGLIHTLCHQVDIFLVKDGILGEGSSFLCLPLHPRKLLFGMLPLFLDKIMHTHKYWIKRQPKFFLQYRLPWDSPLTWVIAAFAIDFCYYWVHRSAHGKSLLLVVLFMIVYWLYYLCITCYLFWVRRSVHGKCLVLVLLFLLVLTCALQLSPKSKYQLKLYFAEINVLWAAHQVPILFTMRMDIIKRTSIAKKWSSK